MLLISSTSRTPAATRGAASTINRPAGSSGRSSRLCSTSQTHRFKTRQEQGTQDVGLRVNYEVSDLWQVATPERDSISVPSRQSCFFAETFRSQDILVVCPVVVLKLAVTICVALYQGFLTWGAEINCRGCWERSHM